MSEKVNRREKIVQAATELFMNKGYQKTSVRDITNRVGCTEAALYYHFKDGKRSLFNEVIESNMPSLMSIVEACEGAQSLYELIMKYGQSMTRTLELRAEKFRWITSEFPEFQNEERKIFHEKHLKFHDSLAELVRPFVMDDEEAHRIAWLISCTGIGYMQVFCALDMK
ncbi:MAG: TetR/AcrR family transcriptional regulator, partial [Chitinophagaceae bacterium]|nr:TetR/AcrR family transcriptional regulator [Anaerolineae bacterium]